MAVFDKTGTLTTSMPVLKNAAAVSPVDPGTGGTGGARQPPSARLCAGRGRRPWAGGAGVKEFAGSGLRPGTAGDWAMPHGAAQGGRLCRRPLVRGAEQYARSLCLPGIHPSGSKAQCWPRWSRVECVSKC